MAKDKNTKTEEVKSFDLSINLEPEETVPVEPIVEVPVPKSTTTKVTVYNKTQFPVELDFGRNREVRIEPKSTVEMDKNLVESPEFRRASKNLIVRN